MPRHGVVHIFVQGSSAWTVGHPKQRYCGNLSMACWSSKGVSAWPAGRPSPACLNTRTFVLTSASQFYPEEPAPKKRMASPQVQPYLPSLSGASAMEPNAFTLLRVRVGPMVNLSTLVFWCISAKRLRVVAHVAQTHSAH